MVVGPPPNVFVIDGCGVGLLFRGGHAVETVFEDGFDVPIRSGLCAQRATAGGFEAVEAVAFAEPDDAETGAVSLLGVRALLEDHGDEVSGVGGAQDPRDSGESRVAPSDLFAAPVAAFLSLIPSAA